MVFFARRSGFHFEFVLEEPRKWSPRVRPRLHGMIFGSGLHPLCRVKMRLQVGTVGNKSIGTPNKIAVTGWGLGARHQTTAKRILWQHKGELKRLFPEITKP